MRLQKLVIVLTLSAIVVVIGVTALTIIQYKLWADQTDKLGAYRADIATLIIINGALTRDDGIAPDRLRRAEEKIELIAEGAASQSNYVIRGRLQDLRESLREFAALEQEARNGHVRKALNAQVRLHLMEVLTALNDASVTAEQALARARAHFVIILLGLTLGLVVVVVSLATAIHQLVVIPVGQLTDRASSYDIQAIRSDRFFIWEIEQLRQKIHQFITASEKQGLRYKLLFDDIPVGLVEVTAEGNVIDANPAWRAMMGLNDADDARSINMSTLLPAESVKLFTDVATTGQTAEFQTRFNRRDGKVIDIEGQVRFRARANDGPPTLLGIYRDVSNKLALEEQLRHAQKMEAIGQLTGGVAHDFNNILMVIMSNIDILDEEEDLHLTVRDRLKNISMSVERAAELTRQLLAFSRKQALRPEPCNVNDLVAAVGKLLRRILGEQIEIESLLEDDIWIVEIDRAQLESALVNLCINARDAMQDGGRLLIETANRTLDQEYSAHSSEVTAGDYVVLAVADTGQGIPAENLDKVFEPFFTTKAVGKGTGLGLSMVYGFIKQSKGHIRINSEVGRGTRIELYLPRGTDELQLLDAAQKPAVARGTERILVVEDDGQVLASVVEQLRSLGYHVTEAVDGVAALEVFETSPLPYDLLLTDVIMPGPMNGKALADEVVRRWPKTKVVFMSGYTEDAIVHHGRLAAGVLLLNKPFRKADLAKILRQALDQ